MSIKQNNIQVIYKTNQHNNQTKLKHQPLNKLANHKQIQRTKTSSAKPNKQIKTKLPKIT